MTTDFSELNRTALISTCDELCAGLATANEEAAAGRRLWIDAQKACKKHALQGDELQAELDTAHEKIANLKQIPACLGPYSILQAENERLRGLIEKAAKGFVLVGSVYSGHPTSKKVERLLNDALDAFMPMRQYICNQKAKQQALNPKAKESDK